jgi:DNA-binding FadR family transcriptional regulator
MIALMQMFEPIRPDRLHDRVTRALAVRILTGTLVVDGSSSTEKDLWQELGVSRTILREAIKVLAAKGLLEVRPKTGVRVKPRSEWNLLDPTLLKWQTEVGIDEKFARNLFQVRLILEPPTAAAAAIAATDEETKEIHQAFLQMKRSPLDFPAYVRADYAFHNAVSRASQNYFLIQINRLVFEALRGTQNIFKKRRDPVTVAAALEQHGKVANAILKRKSEAARVAMVELIQSAERDFFLAFRPPRKSAGRGLK